MNNTIYGRYLQKLERQGKEIMMSQKYHDTIADYGWLKYKGISPGGYAVDYGFCYTLARTLNDFRPVNVLECGLGQSSRLVHQYAAYYNAKAVTCEHDSNWASFFVKEVEGLYPVNIEIVDLEDITIKGYKTSSYKGITERFNGEKFDLILIDGPFASPHYSRSQIIELCKHNLNESFCIIMHDYNRKGEQETIKAVKEVLREKGVDISFTVYSTVKDHALVCSKDLSFLTTL